MLCIDKFQKLLALHLDIEPASLPNIHDIFKSHGYIGVQKGEAIEYFSKGLEEFGENYPQYYRRPKEAITHLLETRGGQVAGAFHKEGLGDIDLVWGDSTFGLAHILERRTQDFIKEGFSEAEAKAKAREFVESIPEIVENGEVTFGKNRAFVDFDNKRSLIALDYKGEDKKWLITAYKEYDAPTPANPHQSEHNINTSSVNRIDGDIKKEKEPSISTDSFTKGETLPFNSKTDSTTKSFNTTKYAEIPKDRFSLETYLNKIELDSIKMDTILKQHPQYTHQELQEIIKHSYVAKSINADKELELMAIKKSGEEEDILYILNLERIGKPYQYEITKLRAYEIGNDEVRMQNAKNLFVQARQAYLQGKDEQSQELLKTLKTKYLIEFSSTDFKDFEYSFPPILQAQGQKSKQELKELYTQKIESIINKDITNAQSGDIAQVSKKGYKKMMSDSAIKKVRQMDLAKVSIYARALTSRNSTQKPLKKK